jgi:Recombination endonuclease VII
MNIKRTCSFCGASFLARKKDAKYCQIKCYPSNRNIDKKIRHLKYNYGITLQDHENMLIKQDNKCGICRQQKTLFVDHDHKSGKVRGLLCSICNGGLGWLDSILRGVGFLWKIQLTWELNKKLQTYRN